MKLLPTCARFVLTISVVLAGRCLWAQDGIKGALSPANLASPLNLSNPFGRTLAVADFDDDHKLDGAVLVDSGRLQGQNTFRIDLHLSKSNDSELRFESAEMALAIEALDVNEDGATDVVIEQTFSHQRLYVWLNDGHGAFHSGRIEGFHFHFNPAGNRFAAPPSALDYSPSFAPQRALKSARLALQSRTSLPPSSEGLKALSRNTSPISRPLLVNTSRAPPLSL